LGHKRHSAMSALRQKVTIVNGVTAYNHSLSDVRFVPKADSPSAVLAYSDRHTESEHPTGVVAVVHVPIPKLCAMNDWGVRR